MPTAIVLEGPRRLVAVEVPRPTIEADDGLLRVEACGLCGTDHEQYTGALGAVARVVPGHETVGVIDEIGERAAARWGVGPGDRVVVEAAQSCGRCDLCATGSGVRCRRHGLRDAYGFVSVDRPPGLWGGYATHHYLAPDTVVHRVPDGMDPVVATLFNPLGAGFRWGVHLPGTRSGDVVAVLGPGIRGIATLVAAKEAGAGFVMVTGAGDRDHARLDLATQLGADLAVDVEVTDPVGALRAATDGALADVVVDVTAKAPQAFGQAVELVRDGGTIVAAGTRGRPVTFHADLLVYKEATVVGALGVDSRSYRDALSVLASGRHGLAGLPRRVEPLSVAGELLAVMAGEGAEPPPVHAVLVP